MFKVRKGGALGLGLQPSSLIAWQPEHFSIATYNPVSGDPAEAEVGGRPNKRVPSAQLSLIIICLDGSAGANNRSQHGM